MSVYPVLMSGEHLWHLNAPRLENPVGIVEKQGDLAQFQESIRKNLQVADQFFAVQSGE